MKNTISVIAIIVALAAGLLWFVNDRRKQGTVADTKDEEQLSQPAPQSFQNTAENTVTIFHTDQGFLPNTLSVKKGTKVTFLNQSNFLSWPATALHPTHAVYPNSNIKKCGTSEEPFMFDACRDVLVGGSYSFVFNEVGSWKYHDHLNPGHAGIIVVE